jgi:hypothetical protein
VRGLDLLVVRAAERVEALDFDFDLDLVMRSSEVMRRHPPHHLSPAQAKPRQGKTPKRAFATSSHHSNAPIKPESQSNLSKIVALFSAIMVSAGGLFSVSSMVTGNAKIGGLDRNCLHRQTTRKRGPSPIGHWRETGCSLGYASLNYCRGETFLSSSAFLEAALLRGVSSKPRTLSACRTCNLNSCTSRYIRPRFENFSGPFD